MAANAWHCSTAYQQASKDDGLAECSSTGKKGPESKIPIKLMELAMTHAALCQVGDGEVKGKDLKRLIGASILGTPHANRYKPESVWQRHAESFRMNFRQ